MTTAKPHWVTFYRQLISLYDFLIGDGSEDSGVGTILYSSQDNYAVGDNTFNKYYRAVIQLPPQYKAEVQKRIDEVLALYHDTVAIDNKGSKNKKSTKRPIYIPRFYEDDERLYKIQIHENKAHSSINHKVGSLVPVASYLNKEEETTLSNGLTLAQTFKQAVQELTQAGYQVEVEDNVLGAYTIAYITVKSLCDIHQCNSIQRRYYTGKQIRANFFTVDEGNLIEKSKLQTIGTVITTAKIEVMRSHKRSTRSDAKYTKRHPDEITLKQIPERLKTGRLYRVYE